MKENPRKNKEIKDPAAYVKTIYKEGKTKGDNENHCLPLFAKIRQGTPDVGFPLLSYPGKRSRIVFLRSPIIPLCHPHFRR